MQTIPFSEVAERRGTWITVLQLSELLAQGSWLNAKIEPNRVGLIRDRLEQDAWRTAANRENLVQTVPEAWAYASYLGTLCDLVVFDYFFIDKIAWERAGSHRENIPTAFGPLADRFLLVEPDRDVYADTIAMTSGLREEIAREKRVKYLEDIDNARTPDRYFEGSLKAAFDYIRSGESLLNLAAPSEFVDSQGSVERVLFYLNLQRMSGVPARLSTARLQVLNNLGIFLPKSIRDQVPAISLNDEMQKWAKSKFCEADDFDAPPIFDLLMREFAGAKTETSLMEVVADVRGWRDTRLYREWLWSYFRAKAERDTIKLQGMKNKLGSHLEMMGQVGDARTRKTRMLTLSLSFAFINVPLTAPFKLPSWRFRSEDYVGFIGDWFATGPRPAEGRIP